MKFDLQMFAEAMKESVAGKQLIYLFRVAEDSKKESASAIAFPTENERNVTKDADTTATKDGTIRTPSVAEIEITSTSVLAKGDAIIDKLEKAMLADKLVECWEVNLAEEGTIENAGKFKSKYYQGYLTECSISSEAEGVVEVSLTFGANGNGADGYASVTKEQQEVASYVYKDVTKESQ